ncbi:MAG: glycine oxidase ThiO [Bythopirellula sp.]|nr:glycine oxidase ThiO [Bythopirellula sp.]
MQKTPETFDVLLVGGGVMGLSLAWELAQQGTLVCVIDSGEMGREASWAAAGMLPPGPSRGHWPNCTAYEQLQGLSHELQPAWHQKLADLTHIDNGFRPTGALYVDDGRAMTMAALEKNQREWDRWGLEYHQLDAAAIADVEPAISPQSQAILLPGESQLRPPRHLKALLAACQREGVDLQPGCQLLGWQTQGEQIRAAITSMGAITAENYCLTSGCWTGPLAAELGLELPIRPVRGQILLLNGPPNTLRRIVNAGPRYLTPRPDGRVLVGSTQEEVGFNKQNTVEGLAELMNFARQLCPALADFTLEQNWSGLRPGTADELPYLGRLPRYENAWIAAGHFRAGIQLSPATAVVMRSLILGQKSPVDVATLGIDRS